jgi:hypothetical protein
VRSHSLRMVLFGAVFAAAFPLSARADDAAGAAGAKDLFEHGRDLRGRGDCAGALPFFQKAYALYPLGLGSLRNIAICQEALSHFASARDAWLELRRAVSASNDSKYSGWSDDADHAIAKLAPKVAHLTADVAAVGPGGDPASSDGVDVSIDGQPLAKDRVGGPVDRDPGTYLVRASGPGVSSPDEQTVKLAAGESKHVSLRVTLAPPPPVSSGEASAPATAVAATSDEGERHTSPMRTGAWIALGVGAAGLAGAAVTFVVRQSALSDLNANCPNRSACDSSHESAVTSDVNRGRTASTLLTVFGAVGLAGAAAGVTLFTLSRPRHATQAALVVSPTGVSAVGSF